MTEDQFYAMMLKESAETYQKSWREAAENLQTNADLIKDNDPVLSSLYARISKDIVTAMDRIRSRLTDLSVHKLDTQETEINQVMEDLSNKLGWKKP